MRSAACHLLAWLARTSHGYGSSARPVLENAFLVQGQRQGIAGSVSFVIERSFATDDNKEVSKGRSSKKEQPAKSKRQDSVLPNKSRVGHTASSKQPTQIEQPEAKQQQLKRLWHSGSTVAELASAPVNKYVDVPKDMSPESTKKYYADPVLADEQVNQPNYGCKAVQAEQEVFGTNSLLNRQCILELQQAIAERRKGHIYLDGWTGSGKSTALYALVNWARKNGWLALYVPSAYLLVEGSSYVKGEDDLWETPEAARYILNSVKDNHLSTLKALNGSGGQPLSKIITDGLAAREPKDVVDAAIKLKEELQALKDVPVLIAVDDYNVLYSHTRYFEAMHAFHHRTLTPEEIRLIRSFRVMEQPSPANGITIAAPTFGNTISEKIRVPLPKGARFHVPRYSIDEVAATVEYFSAVGHIAGTPDIDTMKRAMFLTNGNAKELREYAPALLHDDDALGLSLGYKAMASRMKRYMESV